MVDERTVTDRDWTVVVPVKPAKIGKSRLHAPHVDHEDLARAIALDTITTAAGCDRVAEVIVMTADAQTARILRAVPRVRVVPDTASGLTGALAAGLRAVPETARRAVLLGDLPALRGAELSHALGLADAHRRAFVSDAEGTGSTLATATPGEPLDLLFGPASASAHRAAGFASLELPRSSGLRRDLDTAAHLPAVLAAAPRSRTAALLRVGPDPSSARTRVAERLSA